VVVAARTAFASKTTASKELITAPAIIVFLPKLIFTFSPFYNFVIYLGLRWVPVYMVVIAYFLFSGTSCHFTHTQA
jgi:hypothetical protein